MSQFTLEQLEAFISVVETGSFSAAARKLKKSRSTVHQLVGFLEIDWGVELFDRTDKLPKLKPIADRLYQNALLIRQQRSELTHIADSLSRNIEDKLVISYDELIPQHVLSAIDEEISAHFPNTLIHWLRENKRQAIDAVVNQDVDLTIQLTSGRSRPLKGLYGLNLGSMFFSVYVGANSSLEMKQPCSLSTLQIHQQLIMESFIAAGLKENVLLSANYIRFSSFDFLIDKLERATNTWAILPEHMAKPYVQSKQIKRLPVDFINRSTPWNWTVLSSHEGGGKGPVFNLALESIKKCMQHM